VLSGDEIRRITELCGQAAWNAKKAEFDLVEIHAHGGYLIHQFMSPYFNKRTDEYGGDFDNRCRFLMEIVASMRAAVGSKFPITVKYSIEDFLPGGWDVKQSQALAPKLAAAGISAIGVSSGVHEAKMPAVLPYFYPKGAFIPFAEAIKEVVNIPVIVGGRLNEPEMAEKVIRERKADFLYEGRALIADPDWPRKVANGEVEGVRPCLACNECRQATVNLRLLRCSVNAVAGRESELGALRAAATKKKVLVVGGGPGGMEAARIAAMRGHEVILCEKNRQLGGIALLAGIHNEQITAFINWLIARIKQLPVEVKLQTEVTLALVEEIEPDAVILANGGTFQSLNIPGIEGDNVFSAKDLLNLMNGIPLKKNLLLRAIAPFAKHLVNASNISRMLESNFPIKKKVAVIGGQFPGCSLALFLAQKGKQVTLLEESDNYGYDMEAHTMVGLHNQVQEGKVKIVTSMKIDEVTDRGVAFTDREGNKTFEEAGTVLLALELAPSESDLEQKLRGGVKEIYSIGDAKSFRRIRKAVSEGYVTSHNL
jgi:NADPH-dependent 2,4-dienoyl-CoA reductase/sulfur reductase-like enzyme